MSGHSKWSQIKRKKAITDGKRGKLIRKDELAKAVWPEFDGAVTDESIEQLISRLRRKIEGGDKEQLFLSGSAEVPTGYRELVEEYYRSLSRTGAATERRKGGTTEQR